MCLLILSKTGKEIPKEFLENGYKSNDQGIGFSYAKDGQLFLEKGFVSFDEFYESYKKTIGNPIMCHLRWSSSGGVNKENCHPFEISPNVHFAHNGTMHYWTGKSPGNSDSFAANELMFKKVAAENKNKKWWKNQHFLWFLESAIGSTNRIVFLDSDGNFQIVNEVAGEYTDETKEIWASNDMYKTVKNRAAGNDWYRDETGYHKKYPNYMTPQTASLPERNRLNDPVTNYNGASSSSVKVDITQIPAAELVEVDNYLEALNNV